MRTETREYDSHKRMQKDMPRWEGAGWGAGAVQAVKERRKWSCCLGFLPALFLGARTKYLVTYHRSD